MWSKKELVDRQAEFWVVLARGAKPQAAIVEHLTATKAAEHG